MKGRLEQTAETRAGRVIEFLETLPVTKGIRAGELLELLPHQREFIEAVYGDDSLVRLAIQSIPRGNGKTGLLAGLGLAHLLGPESEPRGEVYVAAVDRLQAGILFNEIVAMIEAVPEFEAQCNVQRFRKVIEVLGDGPGQGSTFEALSADARRGHGLSPTLFVYDEFAQSKTDELLNNLQTAQGKRVRSLGIIISTQSGDDQHPFSVLIDDAERGLDPTLYVQRLSAPPDADPFDESTWRAVNPALDVFLDAEAIRADAERAKRVPSFEAKFRNLRLNQRVAITERWIPAEAWNACEARIDMDALVGEICFGGLDLGSTRDLTAFSLFWPDSGTLATWTFCPADTVGEREHSDRAPYRMWADRGYIELTPGRATDKRFVARRVGELCARFSPDIIGFDRWSIAEFERVLKDEGIELPLKEFGQGFKDMAPATNAFEVKVFNRELKHDNNPLVSWALNNVAIERDGANNAKPNKRRSHDRIDPIVSGIIAVGIAAGESLDKAAPSFQFMVLGGR